MTDMVIGNDFECLACGARSDEGEGLDGNLCPECSEYYLDAIKPELLMHWGRDIRRVLCTIIQETPRLMDHHRPMMRMLHGFAPYHEIHTLEEVAEEFDFPRERIRQLDLLHVRGELNRRMTRLYEWVDYEIVSHVDDESDDGSEELS